MEILFNKLKFKDEIDLQEILRGFEEKKLTYELDSPLDEFISIDKQTRIIYQYGYNGLVYDWVRQDLLERVERED